MNPLLGMMLKDLQSAPALYQPTTFWKIGVERICDDLKQFGVENFRNLTSSLGFFAPKYGFPDYYLKSEVYQQISEKMVEENRLPQRYRLALDQFFSGELQARSDYRVYKATTTLTHPYVDQISESTVGNPVEQFVFENRRFSRSLLNYLLGINYLKRFFNLENIKTVMEIGGGYGTLGEILLKDDRNHCFYMNVDIPPTSFVATYYLKQVIGENHIGDYAELKNETTLDIDALSMKYKGVVLCPWLIPKIQGQVDLFVNFISFQEMEPEVVQNYLLHVDRLRAKYLLLRNLREGKQKIKKSGGVGVKDPIQGQDYDAFLPNYKLIDTNTIPFGHRTEDGFHSELRIYQRR
jgi:putative sugar O-methyltransferase